MSKDEQQKRGGFVPVGDPTLDLPPARLSARRKARHFTQLDQVTQLVAAREADPELGFMARLLLAWVCTEAVRTQSPELILGDSLSEFMRKVGIYSTSGDKHTRLRNQMRRLFGCTVSLLYEDARGEATLNAPIARLTEFWWSERQPDARSLWESKIELGEDFFNEIIRCPIPIDLKHPARDEAVAARPRPLPVAHLSHVRIKAPVAAHVAAALPAVRRGPGQGER